MDRSPVPPQVLTSRSGGGAGAEIGVRLISREATKSN